MTPSLRFSATLAPLLLTGCAHLGGESPRATLPGFQPSAAHPLVWTQTGGEEAAHRVAAVLEPALARVEEAHGLPFRSPPVIHVCQDDDCFRRHVRTPGLTAAVVPGNHLILSARLFGRESSRLPGILTHELSHVHLGQRLGHYSPWLPIWFHEGLATWVAQGAGAEFASPFQARVLWHQGAQIDFSARDTPDRRHRAESFRLGIHDFYLQAWRFVDFLRQRDAAAFTGFLRALQEGTDFHIALADAYNSPLESLAAAFAASQP